MKRSLLALALLGAALAGSHSALAAPAPAPVAAYALASYAAVDPAVQVREWAQLFRSNNLAALAESLVPPSKWEEIRLAYELAQLQPTSEAERAEFAERVEHITAADAVDRLMAELEPELEKARAQLPGALLMGFGALQVAINSPDSELTDAQREALRAMFPGLQSWAGRTQFLSADTLRQALTLMVDAARSTGITDLDQLKALPLDAALERARPLLAAGKQAVRLYGIDVDAIADSLQVEVLEIDGDTARVRTTVTLFGAPVPAEHELVLIDGRWYGKHMVDSLHAQHAAAHGG